MSVASAPYLEFANFVAELSPQAIAGFRPSEAAQARFAELLQRRLDDALTNEEEAELDHFIAMEHVIRIAKAKAKLILERGA